MNESEALGLRWDCPACASGSGKATIFPQILTEVLSGTLEKRFIVRCAACLFEVTRDISLQLMERSSAADIAKLLQDDIERAYLEQQLQQQYQAHAGLWTVPSGAMVMPNGSSTALWSQWLYGSEPDRLSSSEPEGEPPTITGSVLGYRAWRLNPKTWELIGSHSDVPWVPGVNEAVCETRRGMPYSVRRDHPAPAHGCHCGLTALARFADKDAHWGQDADILGAIEAWSDEGGFFLHSTGFRAQFARIVLLAIDDGWPAAKKAAIRALAHEHGADVCKRDHLRDAALEHGQLVSDEMLEWAADRPNSLTEFANGLSYTAQMGALTTSAGMAMPQLEAKLQKLAAYATAPVSLPKTGTPIKGRKGFREVRKTDGPPTGPPSGLRFARRSWFKGDRVQDRKGVAYVCVNAKGNGGAGQWERET